MSTIIDQLEHNIRVHATLMSIGFIVLLPVGVLVARLSRTFSNKWFYAHAAIQLSAFPIIVAGFVYGVRGAKITAGFGTLPQYGDPHTKAGLALFILYLVQVVLGLTSHLFKRPSVHLLLHRTPHQLLHIIVGLAIVGLAFWQVHLGYTFEWPTTVGPEVPAGVNKAWMALVIIFPILYVFGYALFPRQLSQESAARQHGSGSQTKLQKESSSA